MIANSSDKDWEKFGQSKPYYAVLSSKEFLPENLDENTRRKFFESGETQVAKILETSARLWGGSGRERALDFGSGVGRIVIPLARRWKKVVGVDISPSMISEAEKNCRAEGLANVDFVTSTDDLEGLRGSFDFIHSFIVFQHIPAERGQKIIERLVSLLGRGGCGALQFTYHIPGSLPRRIFTALRQRIQLINWAVNLVRGRPIDYPLMQMNGYDLAAVFRFLQKTGIANIHVEFTDHDGYQGVILYFRKPD